MGAGVEVEVPDAAASLGVGDELEELGALAEPFGSRPSMASSCMVRMTASKSSPGASRASRLEAKSFSPSAHSVASTISVMLYSSLATLRPFLSSQASS